LRAQFVGVGAPDADDLLPAIGKGQAEKGLHGGALTDPIAPVELRRAQQAQQLAPVLVGHGEALAGGALNGRLRHVRFGQLVTEAIPDTPVLHLIRVPEPEAGGHHQCAHQAP
jgi:hypothetical protein